jgi:hypothetical protein
MPLFTKQHTTPKCETKKKISITSAQILTGDVTMNLITSRTEILFDTHVANSPLHRPINMSN